MTYLDTLVRLTKREIRELESQRRGSFVMALIFFVVVLLRILLIDGSYRQEDIFGVTLFAIIILVWLNKAHNADLLLALARARQNEIVLMRVDADDAPLLHPELRNDGGVTLCSAKAFDMTSNDVAEALLHGTLRADARRPRRPADRYSLRKDETHD